MTLWAQIEMKKKKSMQIVNISVQSAAYLLPIQSPTLPHAHSKHLGKTYQQYFTDLTKHKARCFGILTKTEKKKKYSEGQNFYEELAQGFKMQNCIRVLFCTNCMCKRNVKETVSLGQLPKNKSKENLKEGQ